MNDGEEVTSRKSSKEGLKWRLDDLDEEEMEREQTLTVIHGATSS